MNTLLAKSISILLAFGISNTYAADKPKMKPYKGSTALEQLKALAGTWKGKSNDEKMKGDMIINYKVTSGGSAVVETFAPGTPMEMVSIYRDIKGKLSMTHYCMLRNQPKLTLKKSSKKQLVLSFNGGHNLNPAKDPHMHGLTLDIKGKDKIVQNWVFYTEGKQKSINTMSLSRVK